jgi:hypothetical protein
MIPTINDTHKYFKALYNEVKDGYAPDTRLPLIIGDEYPVERFYGYYYTVEYEGQLMEVTNQCGDNGDILCNTLEKETVEVPFGVMVELKYKGRIFDKEGK